MGNLPPTTNVIELKDYFSREATGDIESVFLISKSNCAFVNYKSEEACAMAMVRFHDSRFKGVRLVCRLRRATRTLSAGDEGVDPNLRAAIQSAEVVPPSGPILPNTAESETKVGEFDTTKSAELGESDQSVADRADSSKEDRYFVLKSLTVEDLESSLRNGIWATQRHNEIVLNDAYAVGSFCQSELDLSFVARLPCIKIWLTMLGATFSRERRYT